MTDNIVSLHFIANKFIPFHTKNDMIHRRFLKSLYPYKPQRKKWNNLFPSMAFEHLHVYDNGTLLPSHHVSAATVGGYSSVLHTKTY